MNLTHLKYHSSIPRKGIYNKSVKLLLALSIYINSQRFKHNFTPDMLFHLESLEKKQIVNMRETKLDHRNYHDFDK